MELTKAEIDQLQQLCEWLWKQPCHSAFSGQIVQARPHLSRWLASDRTTQSKRKGWIYYQVGYGWRVDKKWLRRNARVAFNSRQ